MTLDQLKQTVNKHMMLENPGVVKLLAATVIANRLPTTSVWLFIVSNSSGGKSMLLDALSDVEGIFKQSDMTANTFASGMKGAGGASVGLLDNMVGDFPIMVISDFTTYLSKASEQNDAIMAQFRLIYDGEYSKRYGTGVVRDWTGRMGLIAGVTQIVYILNAKYSAMGERFMMYLMDQPDREEVTMKALEVVDPDAVKQELRVAFKEYIDSVDIPETLPDPDLSTKKALVQLADLASRARSGVTRNERSREHEIMVKPSPEMPMRMAKQLMNLARAMMILNGDGTLTSEDQQTIYKIALDSISEQRKGAMIQLTQHARMSTEMIASKMQLARESVEPPLEELRALEVVNRIKPAGGGNGWEWELIPKYRELMSKFEHIKMTNEVLIGDSEVWNPPEQTSIDIGDPNSLQAALDAQNN